MLVFYFKCGFKERGSSLVVVAVKKGGVSKQAGQRTRSLTVVIIFYNYSPIKIRLSAINQRNYCPDLNDPAILYASQQFARLFTVSDSLTTTVKKINRCKRSGTLKPVCGTSVTFIITLSSDGTADQNTDRPSTQTSTKQHTSK
jgi:hypothetical protein